MGLRVKPLFGKRSSLHARLVVAVGTAIFLMLAEYRLAQFSVIRHYLDTAIAPFYYVVNTPCKLLDMLSERLATCSQLQLENRALHQELLLKKSDLLLLDHLRQENARLRQLLEVTIRQQQRKMITQVLSAGIHEYSHQITIDKGKLHGVHPGQPVIDDRGVVGQVIATGKISGRVLLICDATHAIPVRVARNDIRAIAYGNGDLESLQLELLPPTIDIKVGDHMVTSGLDGSFPEGYSVATVTSVVVDHQRSHALIKARPTAALGRLRYLLLLWPEPPLDQPKALAHRSLLAPQHADSKKQMLHE